MSVTETRRPGADWITPEHGSQSRTRVADYQRARMLTAVIETVDEVGYAGLTVGRVVANARVSRKTFYEMFDDREDAFLAVFEQGLNDAATIAREAFEGERQWRDGVRSALAHLLAFMQQHPELARLCVVGSLGAGERVLERRVEYLEKFAEVVDAGRFAPNATLDLPPVTGEAVVLGVAGVLYSRLLEHRGESLMDLLGSLISTIVGPYLGSSVAAEEMLRPLPVIEGEPPTTVDEPLTEDPLEGINVRLTYRTVRVLMAIADSPGASNADVAVAADIADPGQVSRLLHRLAGVGLIENHGRGRDYGAANAWRLSRKGRAVQTASRLPG
jgi:AcrR family transcriptional regulator